MVKLPDKLPVEIFADKMDWRLGCATFRLAVVVVAGNAGCTDAVAEL